MNSNYRPPQVQHKEFMAWAREFLLQSIDDKAGKAASEVESAKAEDVEVDVDDFVAHVIATKGGKRFGRHNVKRWRKDATKALRHAIRVVSDDNMYIDRVGDQAMLGGSEVVQYADENLMNRSLFHKKQAPSASATSGVTAVGNGNDVDAKTEEENPPRKRRRVKAPPEEPPGPAVACEVPALTLASVPFVSPAAVDQLLMLTVGVQMEHQGALADGDVDEDAAEHARATSCLLLGPPGSGKTTLCRAVAGTVAMPVAELSSLSLCNPSTAAALLNSAFQAALDASPSLLLLTDVDALPLAGKAQPAGVRDGLLTWLRRAARRVLVVGESALSRARLPEPLKRLFPESVMLGAMDGRCRRAALRHLVSTFKWESRCSASLLDDLAVRTPGFEIEDLHRLLKRLHFSAPLPAIRDLFLDADGRPRASPVSRDALLSAARSADLSSPALVDAALAEVVPLAKQKPGFVCVPAVTWADVGALDGPKRELERFLTMVRQPELAERLCREAESLLLVGPPGCGKTMLAKALSNEAGLNFISVKGPEVLNKFLGESERQIRELFERARACPPCLIFFDELDALCGRRDADGNAGHSSVVLQLLTGEAERWTGCRREAACLSWARPIGWTSSTRRSCVAAGWAAWSRCSRRAAPRSARRSSTRSRARGRGRVWTAMCARCGRSPRTRASSASPGRSCAASWTRRSSRRTLRAETSSPATTSASAWRRWRG